MTHIVKPLWESLNEFLKQALYQSVDNLSNNVAEWQHIKEEYLE